MSKKLKEIIMTHKQHELPEEFWMIYRRIQKAHPKYSKKRIMTVARCAYNKRYNIDTNIA